LWLVPGEPAKSMVQNVIDHQSSDRKTANFRAHVTLVAGLEPEGGVAEVLKKAESLALKLKPIPARVESVACMDLYFKSVRFSSASVNFCMMIHARPLCI